MQNSQAVLSGMTYRGKPMHFALKDSDGRPIPEEDRYVPHFAEKCKECSFQILCNGCFNCGACEGWQTQEKDAQGRKEGGMLHQMPKI